MAKTDGAGGILGGIGQIAGGAIEGGPVGTGLQILLKLVTFAMTAPNASARLDDLFANHDLTPEKANALFKKQHLTTDGNAG